MGSSIVATFNFSPTPCPNVTTHHLPERFHTTPFSKMVSFSGARIPMIVVKCSDNNGETGNPDLRLRDMLSGIVDERVEMLLTKEENRDLLQGLEKAAQRVEIAKRELAEIERQEVEAKLLRDHVSKLQSTTSEIAECQKEISEAKGMIEEAYRSLKAAGGVGAEEMKIESINKDEERLESIKAASVSAVFGTFAELPLSLTRVTTIPDLIFPLGITFVSCALFGITFRYAVRRDLDNFQLKSGTSAAFGIVRGLATLSVSGARPHLHLDIGSFFPIALDAAVYVSENLLIFLFAAVALDFCMKLGILSPFPIDKTKADDKNIYE